VNCVTPCRQSPFKNYCPPRMLMVFSSHARSLGRHREKVSPHAHRRMRTVTACLLERNTAQSTAGMSGSTALRGFRSAKNPKRADGHKRAIARMRGLAMTEQRSASVFEASRVGPARAILSSHGICRAFCTVSPRNLSAFAIGVRGSVSPPAG
jgi:hypothetical protein